MASSDRRPRIPADREVTVNLASAVKALDGIALLLQRGQHQFAIDGLQAIADRYVAIADEQDAKRADEKTGTSPQSP